jgi:hypothetical protein
VTLTIGVIRFNFTLQLLKTTIQILPDDHYDPNTRNWR